MRSILVMSAVAACAFAFAAADGAATEPATWVVDRDGVECANADFDSIQDAVDWAQPGDLIRVCPDLYTESVVVDKPLTLKGDPDALEAVACFDPTPSQLGDLDPTQQAIINPAGDGFAIAFELEANDVEVSGFVIEGASVGIDTGDTFSGFWLHHNLIRLNTLFAVDFGSEGTRESRADHNCIRENLYGLVTELDDDTFWPDLENRAQNARDLINARADHNSTFRNLEGIAFAGPGLHDAVTIDHNVSRGESIAILIQNSEGSRIVDNELLSPTVNGVRVGGANTGLEITRNIVMGGQQGIVFAPAAVIDVFTEPTEGATIAENTVSGQRQDGFVAAGPPNAALPAVMDSQFLDNVASDNLRDGFVLRGVNADNTVRGNLSQRNGRYGIFVQGAVENLFETNIASHNGVDGISLQRAVRLGVNYDATDNTFLGNVAEANGRYGIFADRFTARNVFELNWMFGNAIHDAHDDAFAANTWSRSFVREYIARNA
jgi:nitrous oxidase accessory protein NosD